MYNLEIRVTVNIFSERVYLKLLIQTMSLASGTVNNPAIDNLIQSSLKSESECLRLEWISYKGITNVKPTQIDNTYCAVRNGYAVITCEFNYNVDRRIRVLQNFKLRDCT